jgi:putative endonuclease
MWLTYVIETQKGRYYTGVTRDINARFLQHLGVARGGAKFFRSDKPVMLVYLKKFSNRSLAQKHECFLKSLTRTQKELEIFS